jgi:triosephosphate isomerase
MHGSRARVRDFAYQVNAALAATPSSLTVIFCPPAIYLEAAHSGMPTNARLKIGGQNAAEPLEGAFTGGIGAPMLKDAGADYVILGHSERRHIMGETDAQVAGKAITALDVGLTPIICIGETEAEYVAGQTLAVLSKQLEAVNNRVKGAAFVAYEPVWAIGTGRTPTLDEIEAAHSHVKSALGSAWPVLYGGSVKPANIHDILSLPSVDGALIGGASLEADSMKQMVAAAAGL